MRGLSKSDRIAYPSEQFEVGLKTTENAAEANVPDIGSADDEGGEQLVAEGGNDEFDADFTIDDNDAAFDDEEDGELIIEGEPDDYFDIETEEE